MADIDPRKMDRGGKADAVRRLRHAQQLVRQLPAKPISVDEFIAEKRREAQRDA